MRFLSGDDIFISYSRRDGASYATGLADELTRKKLSCFTDKLGVMPGHDLPPDLIKRIRNSSVFVLVGTEMAARSEFVRKEIAEFKKTGRTILPIDFDGNVGRAVWYEEIPGLAVEPERRRTALKRGSPSPNVIRHIEKSFNYTRRNVRMFRMFWAALSLVLILTGIGLGASYYASNQLANARKQEERAAIATERATAAAKLAEEQEKIALDAQAEAARQTEIAGREKAKADAAGKLADEKSRLAEEKTKLAEQETEKARLAAIETAREKERAAIAAVEAEKQEKISQSRQLAYRSQTSLLSNTPGATLQSIRYAVDSVKIVNNLGIFSGESDNALQESLALIPRLDKTIPLDDAVKTTALSPNGRYRAVLTGGNEVKLLETKEPAPLGSVSVESASVFSARIGVSDDGKHIALASGRNVQLIDDLKRGQNFSLPEAGFYGDWIQGVAVSPDGKYVAALLKNSEDEENSPSFVALWQVKDRSAGAPIKFAAQVIWGNSIVFGTSGKVLAVGGDTYRSGKRTGTVVMWSFEKLKPQLTAEDFASPARKIDYGEMFGRIAVYSLEKYATAGSSGITVWSLDPSGYVRTPISQIPSSRRVSSIAFLDGGDQFASEQRLEDDPSGMFKTKISIWDTMSRNSVFRTLVDSEVMSVSFTPDGGSVISRSEYGTSDKCPAQTRVWPIKAESGPRDCSIRYDKFLFQSPDLKYLITSDDDGFWVWNTRTASRQRIDRTRSTMPAVWETASMSNDGETVVLAGHDPDSGENTRNIAEVYSAGEHGYTLTSQLGLAGHGTSLSLLPDKISLLVLYDDGRVRVHDLGTRNDKTPDKIKELRGVESVMVSPRGNFVFTFGPDQSMMWRISDGAKILSHAGKGESSAYDIDQAEQFVISVDLGKASIINLRTRKTVPLPIDLSGSAAPLTALKISADGRYVGFGVGDGGLFVFEAASGKPVVQRKFAGQINDIAFAPKNNHLAIAMNQPWNDLSGDLYVIDVILFQQGDLITEAEDRIAKLSTEP